MPRKWHSTGSPTATVDEEKFGSFIVHCKSVPAGRTTSRVLALRVKPSARTARGAQTIDFITPPRSHAPIRDMKCARNVLNAAQLITDLSSGQSGMQKKSWKWPASGAFQRESRTAGMRSAGQTVSASFHHNIHFATFASAQKLKSRSAVGRNFEIAHTPQDAEHFPRRALGVAGTHASGLALASYRDLESRRLRLEQRGRILRRDVSDEISKAVDFQHDTAQRALVNRFGTRRSEADVIRNLVSETVGFNSLSAGSGRRGRKRP